jgi:exodeoxyribonuclease V beta subunit
MDLLIARLEKTNPSTENYYEHLYSRISKEDGSSLKDFIRDCKADISIRELVPQANVPVFSTSLSSQVLLKPKVIEVPGKPLFVQSFTSLSQGVAANPDPSAVADAAAPHNFVYEATKSPLHLPAGSDTGTLLHKILECVPFAESKLWEKFMDVRGWVRPFLKGTLFVEWEETIASMVFDAFKTQLPGLDGGFCLAEVDPKKVYRETEFFFVSGSMVEDSGLLFDDTGVQPGFLKGVIDLFFEYRGKYYLLDWKSNWLGATLESYGEEGLCAAMLQHNYHLQAGIYAEAMRRYLRLFDKRPFEELFGGAYYLFLRGLSTNSGIYHFYPSKCH